MESDYLLFGRNVLKEALLARSKIKEIFFESEAALKFAESLTKQYPLRRGLPREVQEQNHQGIAFKVQHAFYLSSWTPDSKKYPRVLLCNHLEDVQNLGSLARSAAAFDFTLIVHEERRSVRLNPAAIKISAGQAFRLHFLEVSNLLPLMQKMKKESYVMAGLDMGDEAEVWNLYRWDPPQAVGLVVGSEESGISKPVLGEIDDLIRIPMNVGVESLNAAQAGTIAMSRCYGALKESPRQHR